LEANGLDTSRIRSFYLTRDEIKPILKLGKGDKEKIVNAFGLWCLVVSLITCPIWAAAMNMLNLIYRVQGDAWDPNRSLYDTTGKLWAKSWLTLSNSMPTFSGHIEHIQQQGGGPCLYVANHASWLDIPILCTVLDPVFKFIAKGELRGVPCIGQQLVGVSDSVLAKEELVPCNELEAIRAHIISSPACVLSSGTTHPDRQGGPEVADSYFQGRNQVAEAGGAAHGLPRGEALERWKTHGVQGRPVQHGR
jgi:hypothetical protein